MEEFQFRQSQRFCFWNSATQSVIKLFHQLGGRLVRHSPQAGHRGSRAGRKQRATESLDALAIDDFAALGVASRQRRQVHAVQIEAVDLLEEEVIRRLIRLGGGKQDSGALGIVIIGGGVRASVGSVKQGLSQPLPVTRQSTLAHRPC